MRPRMPAMIPASYERRREGGQEGEGRAIQAWMGHKNIRHTVRYTELAPDRFKDLWRE